MNRLKFDPGYYERLYGTEAKQTWADKMRDARIGWIVDRYCPNGTARPALLDIGCGFGYLLERFQGRFRLFGMDISEHGTQRAQDRLPGAQVKAGDIQTGIPFAEKFHVILMVNVIEHLLDPRSGLSRVRDALRMDGICVVHLPTINNCFNAWIYSLTYNKDRTHIYRPSAWDLSGLFGDLGLERLEESYSPHTPRMVCNFLKLHPSYLAAYRRRG
jgi:2-polyprenyl-3-methyl-5-hydroxy-6-metoxy-1,4-benzoquinol methylase